LISMPDRDLSAATGLLLGTAGWNRPDWAADYYPADLPDDWRLAFLANDCGCVLLRPPDWCGLDEQQTLALQAAVEEAPDTLTFLLQMPAAETPPAGALARFSELPCILLAAQSPMPSSDRPVWVADGADCWVAPDGGQALVWTIDQIDLRALRDRARTLPRELRALILDGPAASPAAIGQVRTLLQLLGIA
jgi:hypothetical protein